MKEKTKLIAIYLLGIVLLIITACNPEKITARKDAKALDRVVTSKPLLDSAGRVWSELHPCEDPDPVIIEGETKTVTIVDSTKAIALAKRVDSLLKNIKPDTNIDSLKKVIKEQILKECQSSTTNSTRVDTALQANYRALQIEKENHNRTWQWYQAEKELRIKAQQQTIQAQESEKAKGKKLTLYMWLFYGLLAAIVIGVVLRLKSWKK